MSVQLFHFHKILMEKGKKLDNKEVLILSKSWIVRWWAAKRRYPPYEEWYFH